MSASDSLCPKCSLALGEVQDQGVPFLGCQQCFGLFVSEPDLFTYVEKATSPRVFASFLELHEKMISSVQPGTIRKCPICLAQLGRAAVGENPIVLVDRCPDHGIWLDRTELKKLIRAARSASGQKPDPHADGDDDEGPMGKPGAPAKAPPPKPGPAKR